MNQKITSPEIIAQLIAATSLSRTDCERFVKELPALIADTLADGENVKIKGLGTFKVTEVEPRKSVNVNTGEDMLIPGHRRVSFTPDKQLSADVNAPFEMFEPVELEDTVTEQMLEEMDAPTPQPAPEPQAEHQPMPQAKETEKEEVIIEKEAADEPAAQANPVLTPEPPVQPDYTEQPQAQQAALANALIEEEDEPVAISEPAPEPVLMPEEPSDTRKKEEEINAPAHKEKLFNGWLMAATAVVAMIVLFIAWRVIFPASFCAVTGTQLIAATDTIKPEPIKIAEAVPPADTLPEEEKIVPVNEPAPAKTVDEVPTQSSDAKTQEPVKTEQKEEKPKEKKTYDTISNKRFLTTMAKKYYGSYHLWPYIYDANANLGNPSGIKPGTKIYIPSIKELGIDPTDPATIDKAKRRGVEIYSHYR